MDETQTETQTTSTLLDPGYRPGTYPLIEEVEEELNASKHRSRVRIIA